MGEDLLETNKPDARRSTRISREIAIEITSLDPAFDYRAECTTVMINAHGCGVILREPLRKGLPVMVKLVSNGQIKKGRVVFGVPLPDASPWLTGIEFENPSNFWGNTNHPADWPLV
jgi:hypothetical protein